MVCFSKRKSALFLYFSEMINIVFNILLYLFQSLALPVLRGIFLRLSRIGVFPVEPMFIVWSNCNVFKGNTIFNKSKKKISHRLHLLTLHLGFKTLGLRRSRLAFLYSQTKRLNGFDIDTDNKSCFVVGVVMVPESENGRSSDMTGTSIACCLLHVGSLMFIKRRSLRL